MQKFFYDENKFIFTENMFFDVLKFVPIDKKIGFKFLNFYTKYNSYKIKNLIISKENCNEETLVIYPNIKGRY